MGVEDDDGNRDEYFAPSLKTWSFYTFFVCVCVCFECLLDRYFVLGIVVVLK